MFFPLVDCCLDGALNGERALHRINDAGELDQRPVADQFDDPAMMGGNSGIEDRLAMTFECRQRAGLVGAHHTGIANHISGEDSRQASVALFGLGHGRYVLDRALRRQRRLMRDGESGV